MGGKRREDLVTVQVRWGRVSVVRGSKRSRFAPLIIHESRPLHLANVSGLRSLSLSLSFAHSRAVTRTWVACMEWYARANESRSRERWSGRTYLGRVWERKIIHHVRGYPELAVAGTGHVLGVVPPLWTPVIKLMRAFH